ncbi:MAG: hypothetical protein JWQ19_3042 [Subtercola sp.]|nr:hypothetical protein [Subtercola sp.]
MSEMTGERVRFQDVKPYDAPARLDELRGPATGTVQLPRWVYWGPNSVVDLDTEWGVIKAYQATIQEGSTEDQVQILNRDVLISVWPELRMPPRVRQLWEGRFPELKTAGAE